MNAAAREEAARPVRLHPGGGAFWQVRGGFGAAVRLVASRGTAEARRDDGTLAALRPVSHLPDIAPPIVAFSNLAQAHGVPHGVTAVTDPGPGGLVIPGAIGHDIGSGVLAAALPCGASAARRHAPAIHAALKAAGEVLDNKAFDAVCTEGARWAGAQSPRLIAEPAACDHGGAVNGADPRALSATARARGLSQFGEVAFPSVSIAIAEASAHGKRDGGPLKTGQAVLLVFAGSRGLGHQITAESVELMVRAAIQYRIPIQQRALACTPVHSHEGRAYLAAMAAASNYALAQRQWLAARVVTILHGLLGGKAVDEARVLTNQDHQGARLGILRDRETPRSVLIHRKGCFALTDAPGRLHLLMMAGGENAWLAAVGPGARATFHTAGWIAERPDKQALVEGGVVRVVGELCRITPV